MERRAFLGGLGAALAAGACASPLKPEEAELSGNWDGVAIGPNRSFQVVLRIGSGAGPTGARLDRPEYADRLQASFRCTGSMVDVAVNGTVIRVEGRLEPDGETITAIWRGRVLDGPSAGIAVAAPLVLKRRRPGAADPAPPGLEEGEFLVPEDRNLPRSREIAIRYLRIRSTSQRPGSPLIRLIGGPGAALIDPALAGRGELGLWRFYERDRDVILLDQRGAGRSNHIPDAPDPSLKGLTYRREDLIAWYRRELPKQWRWWESKGVAMSGYTTRQNAADVDDLRKHIGADRICLHGGSYGSHLALAVLKYHGTSVERVALSGLEGLDQTIKRPSAVDAMLGRLAAKIAADPEARKAYPDLLGLMRRVHAKLDAAPIKVPGPGGRYDANSFSAKLLINSCAGSTEALSLLPQVYRMFDDGKVDDALAILPRGAANFPWPGPMNLAMDVASGVSDARFALVAEEAKTALVGDALNLPHPYLRDIIPLDLGDEFRAPFRSNVPALFHNGDLDGRTPLEEAREVARQFANAQFVEMENGSHFMGGEAQVTNEVAFLRGEPITRPTFSLPQLRFRQ
jgi:pimeloyl-ACP methyl ester carboxylesterase